MKGEVTRSRRKELLAAAAEIVNTEGASRLTLDAVAKKAGVSKGGILYHFPTKEDLIKSMINEKCEVFIQGINEVVDHNEGMKWSEAYANATFVECNSDAEMSSALLAATFTNPKLLSTFQEQYEEIQDRILKDADDPVVATILRLASDGLWFSETFGLAPIDEELRKKVYDRLLSLIQEGNRGDE